MVWQNHTPVDYWNDSLVYGDEAGSLIILNKDISRRVPAFSSKPFAVGVSPSGFIAAIGRSFGSDSLRIWRSNDLSCYRAIDWPKPYALFDNQVMIVEEQGVAVSTGDVHGGIHVWDAKAGALDDLLWGQEERVECVRTSANGVLLVTVSSLFLRVYNLKMRRLLWEYPCRDARCVAVNSTGTLIACGYRTGRLSLFRLADTNATFSPPLQRRQYQWMGFWCAAAVSPAGHIAISSGRKDPGKCYGVISLWDATTGELVRKCSQISEMIETIAFSRDGKVVLGVTGYEAFGWHTDTGALIATKHFAGARRGVNWGDQSVFSKAFVSTCPGVLTFCQDEGQLMIHEGVTLFQDRDMSYILSDHTEGVRAWQITVLDAQGVDAIAECQNCGHQVGFSPARHEEPPEVCPKCRWLAGQT